MRIVAPVDVFLMYLWEELSSTSFYCAILILAPIALSLSSFLKNFYWSIVDFQCLLVSGVQQSESVVHISTLF